MQHPIPVTGNLGTSFAVHSPDVFERLVLSKPVDPDDSLDRSQMPTRGANCDLRGRVAVITGATSGIGLALAMRAGERGMKVALAAENQQLLSEALERVKTKNVQAIAVPTDMCNLTAVRKFARRIERQLGTPWLVCGASDAGIDVNLRTIVHNIEVFAPDLVERGAGHIVNVVSPGLVGGDYPVDYVAAMHAISGISEQLYRELDGLRSGVGVTLVCASQRAATLTTGTRYQHCLPPPSMRNAPLRELPPEAIAGEVFAAIRTRRFRVFADASQDACTDSH